MHYEYLLFLRIPLNDVYDTPGDYYYLFGTHQSVYVNVFNMVDRSLHMHSDEVFVRYSSNYYDDSLARVLGDFNYYTNIHTLNDIREIINAVNDVIPAKTLYCWLARFAESLQFNVDSGFLDMSEDDVTDEIYEILNPPQRMGRIR